ncbi:MAG: hypothetical protein KDC35_20560 [Acidobacteria bacterium]|nr:hypothetical protein [Acidobacteriota bacterium]
MSEAKAPVNKGKFWAYLLELFTVFLGVYGAFLLNNYQEEKKREQQRNQLVDLVKFAVTHYESRFGGFAAWQETHLSEFRNLYAAGAIPDFGDAYYPAPQYPIDVFEYILTEHSYSLATKQEYLPLVEYVNGVKRLMYVEEQLVMLSDQYAPLPTQEGQSVDFVRQRHLAARYQHYMQLRINICRELVKISQGLKQIWGIAAQN